MDNLSHTLLGAALGEAGLKTRTRLGMTTLVIGANLPDVDVLAIPFGEELTFRRGWTHGPLALLALPLLLAAGVVAWDRLRTRRGRRPSGELPVRPGQVLLLSWIGVLSHPLLDWLNTYGIRLLMPLSQEWFYGDALFIVDPWMWAALGLGVLLSRRAGRRPPASATRPARLALGAAALYVALMVAGSRAAERSAIRAAEARGLAPVRRVMAGPVPVNPLRRQLVYDVGDAYRFGVLTWTPRPEVVLAPERLPKNEDHPAVRDAVRREPVRDFLCWSRFPFFRVGEEPAAFRVHVGDARYARDARGGWASASVVVDREPTAD